MSDFQETSIIETPLKNAILARISSSKKTRPQTVEVHNNIEEDFDALEQQVLKVQSKRFQGYYEYQNWMQFSKTIFPYVDEKTSTQLWKILRVINYGQVLIPTGLIYQITDSFLHNKKDQNNLQTILNQFLEANKSKDKVYNFRELSNYRKLSDIQNIYNPKRIQNSKAKKKYSSKLQNQPQKCNVHERNFNEAKIRKENSRSIFIQSINEEAVKYPFKPNISQEKSENNKSTSMSKIQRVCQHKQKYKYRGQQDILQMRQYKANQFNPSIFEEGLIKEIPGVQNFIKRNKYSQAQRQRIERMKNKPGGKKFQSIKMYYQNV